MVLVIATALALYLLVVLSQLHRRHKSPAWGFIFTGIALLALECVGLLLDRFDLIDLSRQSLDWVVLAKAACYTVGFTLWKRDLRFSDYLRRITMPDEKPPVEPGKPADPPKQPSTPEPKGPPVKPTGDVPGPGKSGDGGGG